MLSLFGDLYQTLRLRVQYRRRVQERVLDLLERESAQGMPEENGRWQPTGFGGAAGRSEPARIEQRTRARQLVQSNPYARNILRLLENYVTGPGLQVTAVPKAPGTITPEQLALVNGVWSEFLHRNRNHFSFREFARRTWRDGECFLRLFPAPLGVTSVRFVDPERIGGPPDDPTSNGLITAHNDCEQVLAYQLLGDHGELLEEVSADELLQTRLSTDSNEPRGITWFAPLLEPLSSFEKWLDVELQARKLQASIVLWRKVNGSPVQVSQAVDAAAGGGGDGPDAVRRERWRAGTILTTSQGTDLQFLQPQTNFGDAVPLGRLLLLAIAAGAGLPEYMVACDASNGNFASTMVAEGPAVKLFESEQHFFADQWNRLWDKVLDLAVQRGVFTDALRQQVVPRWSFPQLVNRDRVQERTVDARLIEAGVLSRSEVARRDGVDPHVMREERATELSSAQVTEHNTAQNGGEQHAVR